MQVGRPCLWSLVIHAPILAPGFFVFECRVVAVSHRDPSPPADRRRESIRGRRKRRTRMAPVFGKRAAIRRRPRSLGCAVPTKILCNSPQQIMRDRPFRRSGAPCVQRREEQKGVETGWSGAIDDRKAGPLGNAELLRVGRNGSKAAAAPRGKRGLPPALGRRTASATEGADVADWKGGLRRRRILAARSTVLRSPARPTARLSRPTAVWRLHSCEIE